MSMLHAVEMGAGPPVAILHGLFGSVQNWGSIQKALAARHRVLAVDLPNHGASPHGPEMSYKAMAAAVAARLGEPMALLGHSMGGKVAMALALTRPELVTRLVVVDIAPVTYPPSLRSYVAAMQAVELREGLTRREADAALAPVVESPAERGFLLQNLRFGEGAPAWRLGLDEIAAAMPGIESFPAFRTRYEGPVLVVSGERSGYVRAANHELFRTLFPRAEFAVVPGAGHWLHAENPKAFLGYVEPFLAT
ncbi:alpha/beta fold hydrolase [Siccirubricoccus sp. KC 17139]|uniref:Alpha/beta fold hydrolase n=1 Tax=Siccirubricoccus soli TaxID=2899147 RepID=A0ABT1CYF8_9PROT|nr:alpha/beta fold hydrolase [Siccirubricoccus soli]MCO6414699.1 alpha/beta fold hydrolase [Siccirubricoccus soli]MCP2680829.1 alpha/beta fold hydrolase [Siccirubricoccus soli]